MTNDLVRDFTGLWLSADHSVRKFLLPNGRFIALLDDGRTRHQGEYCINGNRIAYRKDSGVVGEGEFINGVLYSGSFALYAEGFEEADAA